MKTLNITHDYAVALKAFTIYSPTEYYVLHQKNRFLNLKCDYVTRG